MRYRVTIRPEAEEDLAKIYDIIADDNPATAMRFVDGIRDLSMSLDHFPRRGKPRDDVTTGVRTLVYRKRATIAYRILDDTVEVTRVFYAGRDYEAILRRQGTSE